MTSRVARCLACSRSMHRRSHARTILAVTIALTSFKENQASVTPQPRSNNAVPMFLTASRSYS